MNSKTLYRELTDKIKGGLSLGERETMAMMLLQKSLGLSRADVLSEKGIAISPMSMKWMDEAIGQLNRDEPIQYVLGEAWFMGRLFKVNRSVLIPRPETEELVQCVLDKAKSMEGHLQALDIGTGSGCIAITLSLDREGMDVMGLDISDDALHMAEENQKALKSSVRLVRHDILSGEWPWSPVDIVVSNPPYIGREEASGLDPRVVDFEPHLALFVPADDPLVFYKGIAARGVQLLKKGGCFFVEVHERYGRDVAEVFRQHGFAQIEIQCDLSGKERIVSGIKC